MGRDQEPVNADQFEWMNDWAQSAKPEAAAAPPVESTPAAKPEAARSTSALPTDQLMRDIAEIERRRDALAAIPVSRAVARQRTQALTLVPSRTTDAVPVVVGGVLALVMLTVFGAAAAMTKLSR